jgi:hypothetical protein
MGRVQFWARKEVRRPVRVNFTRSTGERVSFRATKIVKKPVRVSFNTRRRWKW